MNAQRGFTLTELVLTIVLIGILAVVAVPRLQFDAFDVGAAHGELVTAVRHAQSLAMAHSAGNGYRVTITGDGYRVTTAAGAAVAHPYAGSADYATSFPGITLAPTGTLSFDGKGRPSAAGGLGFTGNSLTVTLSAGSQQRTLLVENYTGYAR